MATITSFQKDPPPPPPQKKKKKKKTNKNQQKKQRKNKYKYIPSRWLENTTAITLIMKISLKCKIYPI